MGHYIFSYLNCQLESDKYNLVETRKIFRFEPVMLPLSDSSNRFWEIEFGDRQILYLNTKSWIQDIDGTVYHFNDFPKISAIINNRNIERELEILP